MTPQLAPWLRSLAFSLPLALTLACDDGVDTDPTGDTDPQVVDADGDGFGEDEDCDDDNADIYPGAPEDDCEDPVDYNCDGETPLYADADSDGFAECVDCNDNNADINPDALELCDDAIDNDCDDLVDDEDDSVSDPQTWFEDADGDTFGNAESTLDQCAQPDGYVADNTDCDDTEADAFPGNTEVCDEIDNDCDELVDDADDDVTDQMEWWADSDGDDLGDAEDSVIACFMPEDYTDNDLDCDDTTDTIGEAPEWFADNDGDGFGNASRSTFACEQPKGHVVDDTDCDDRKADVNPAADEVCDRVDNDCDGDVDDDDPDVLDPTRWFADDDGDGFGDEDDPGTLSCVAPSDTVEDDTDCDDTLAAVNPDMPFDFDDDEDNDCDGSTDEDVGSETYAHDLDIQGIWNSNCTGCHGSSGGLSLASSAHGRIVDVKSSSVLDYIEPGLPDSSYLFRKVEGTHSSVSGGGGAKMPRGGSLSSSDIAKIETWIEEGAVK